MLYCCAWLRVVIARLTAQSSETRLVSRSLVMSNPIRGTRYELGRSALRKRIAIAAVVLAVVLALPVVAQAQTLTAKYRGVTIEGVKTKKKVIALDFDDGPIDSGKIINIFSTQGGTPTFFWVGSRITSGAAEYAVKHHAEINAHSWAHKDLTEMSYADKLSQINRVDARIAQFTGKRPLWFRAPYNAVNGSLLNLLASTQHLYAHQYLMTRDYDPSVSPAALVKIFNRPQPGAIYLFHEGCNSSLKALPTILKNLRKNGWKVVTNTQLLSYGAPVHKLGK